MQGDQQVLAVATERGVAVYALPSQRMTGSNNVSEGCTVIRSSIVSWSGSKQSPLILMFTSEGLIKGKYRVLEVNNTRTLDTVAKRLDTYSLVNLMFCIQNKGFTIAILEDCGQLWYFLS